MRSADGPDRHRHLRAVRADVARKVACILVVLRAVPHERLGSGEAPQIGLRFWKCQMMATGRLRYVAFVALGLNPCSAQMLGRPLGS